MTWIQRYRIRHYFQNSVWILPVFGMIAALISVNVLFAIDRRLGWKSALDPAATMALFGTLAGSMFTFIVFLASSLLLVLQLASAALSPRIVGIVFSGRVIRFALALFTFTFTLAVAVLVRIHDAVPDFATRVTAYCCLISICVFLYLIDYVGKALRPSGAMSVVSRLGHRVIKSVYPRPWSTEPEPARPPVTETVGSHIRTIRSPKDGVLLAFDPEGIVALAQATDCVIQLVPEVGDFVSAESPLFRIYGEKEGPSAAALCGSVALGQERTMEQDPAFAFRILVDIASKALSPAINDPTTAVLAIDQLHYLLRSVGGRRLDEGVMQDSTGTLRLVYPTPNWEDFVYLAVTEIRHFGGSSIQVTRRLRAMLEDLSAIMPPERTALLRSELEMLHRSALRFFLDPEDQAMADISDRKGVGGKRQDAQFAASDSETALPEPKGN